MSEYENALFPDPVKLLALSTACLVSSKVLMKSALVMTGRCMNLSLEVLMDPSALKIMSLLYYSPQTPYF